MTRQQENAVNRMKLNIVNDICPNSTDYEIKTFEVTEYDSFVALYCVTGLKGDENTLAAVYCRDRIHLFIGRRGGIKYPVTNKRGQHVCRELGRHSLYHVAYEQKYN